MHTHDRKPAAAKPAASRAAAPQGPALAAPPLAANDLWLRLATSGLPLQPRLEVGAVDDPLESEAERVAQQVAGAGTAAPTVAPPQPMQPQRPGPVAEALGSPGAPLPGATRAQMEPRFGRDFSQVRVHTGGVAAASATAARAAAYTVGRDIVFGPHRYDPDADAGRRLLAHELAHVVQQQPGGGREGPGPVRGHAPAPRVQRQFYSKATATASDPNALIPLADFIRYIEAVEKAYPSDKPEEVLTRIRQRYYSGLGFDELIPDAPKKQLVTMPHLVPGKGGPMVVNSSVAVPRMLDTSIGPDAWSHLTAKADENGYQGNPSPYIVMPDATRIDVGHLLLGLDSLLHPRVDAPYTAYGIPGIDPASWVADLALAAYWTSYHYRNGKPAGDAPVSPPTPDFDVYYKASAPDEDLLGDADSFGTHATWTAKPGQTLSQVLRGYYLGAGGAAPGLDRRWRTFCSANGWGYTLSGASITWAAGIDTVYLPRIDRLCDLFDSGFFSKVGSMMIGSSPAKGSWPFSAPALLRFQNFVKPRLEAEIAAHP